jgi:hypothetical protein
MASNPYFTPAAGIGAAVQGYLQGKSTQFERQRAQAEMNLASTYKLGMLGARNASVENQVGKTGDAEYNKILGDYNNGAYDSAESAAAAASSPDVASRVRATLMGQSGSAPASQAPANQAVPPQDNQAPGGMPPAAAALPPSAPTQAPATPAIQSTAAARPPSAPPVQIGGAALDALSRQGVGPAASGGSAPAAGNGDALTALGSRGVGPLAIQAAAQPSNVPAAPPAPAGPATPSPARPSGPWGPRTPMLVPIGGGPGGDAAQQAQDAIARDNAALSDTSRHWSPAYLRPYRDDLQQQEQRLIGLQGQRLGALKDFQPVYDATAAGTLTPPQLVDRANDFRRAGADVNVPARDMNFGMQPQDILKLQQTAIAAHAQDPDHWQDAVYPATGKPLSSYFDTGGNLLQTADVGLSPEAQAKMAGQRATANAANARASYTGAQMDFLTGPKTALTQAEKDLITNGKLPEDQALTNYINKGQLPQAVARTKYLLEGQLPEAQARTENINASTSRLNAITDNLKATGNPAIDGILSKRSGIISQVTNAYLKPTQGRFGMNPSLLVVDEDGNLAVNPSYPDSKQAQSALNAAASQWSMQKKLNDQAARLSGSGQVDMSSLSQEPQYGGGYRQIIAETAKRYGIDPAAVQAIIKRESGGRPSVTNQNNNGTTDYGIMQVNSATRDPKSYNWQDPSANIDAGAAEFAAKLKAAGGDYHKAFHLYNGLGAPASKYADPVFADYQRLKGGNQGGGQQQASSAPDWNATGGGLKWRVVGK